MTTIHVTATPDFRAERGRTGFALYVLRSMMMLGTFFGLALLAGLSL